MRRAEIAVAARSQAIGGIAEVLDERGHPALLRVGEGCHTVELGAAERQLSIVASTPVPPRCDRLGAGTLLRDDLT